MFEWCWDVITGGGGDGSSCNSSWMKKNGQQKIKMVSASFLVLIAAERDAFVILWLISDAQKERERERGRIALRWQSLFPYPPLQGVSHTLSHFHRSLDWCSLDWINLMDFCNDSGGGGIVFNERWKRMLLLMMMINFVCVIRRFSLTRFCRIRVECEWWWIEDKEISVRPKKLRGERVRDARTRDVKNSSSEPVGQGAVSLLLLSSSHYNHHRVAESLLVDIFRQSSNGFTLRVVLVTSSQPVINPCLDSVYWTFVLIFNSEEEL